MIGEGYLGGGLVFWRSRNMEEMTMGNSVVQGITKRESNLCRLIGWTIGLQGHSFLVEVSL
jgi:hypothetical protein